MRNDGARWHFGPFCFDERTACLFRDGERISLRPQAADLLLYLLANSQRLVTKEEIRAQIWPGVAVGPTSVTSCVREIREALADCGRQGQFIATVHGRGYRFVGETRRDLIRQGVPAGATRLFGREGEAERIWTAAHAALRGEKRLLCLTGEPGIGKTALVSSVVEAIESGSFFPDGDRRVLVAHGQCIEHHGEGEPFMPLIEALTSLTRRAETAWIAPALFEHAPAWRALLEGTDNRQFPSADTSPRAVRLLLRALENVTARQPLVLIIEDIQWTDSSTVEFIAAFAQRREPLAMLLIPTYRSVASLPDGHVWKRTRAELFFKRLCEEICLPPLSRLDAEQLLASRFPGAPFLQGLTEALHRRTDGVPLFLSAIADHLVRRGLIARNGEDWVLRSNLEELAEVVPDNLRLMIDEQFDGCAPEERSLLLAASIIGVRFSTQALAAALGASLEEVETRCTELVRRGLFLRCGPPISWPDGSAATGFAFVHALHRGVVGERVTPARRRRLHRSVALRIEQGFATRPLLAASELALHFARAGDHEKSAWYHHEAGLNASARQAHGEAIGHFRSALASLSFLPATSDRVETMVNLLLSLGASLIAVQGFAAPAVGEQFERALGLCAQIDQGIYTLQALAGLATYRLMRARLADARAAALEIRETAGRLAVPPFILDASDILTAQSCLYGGDPATALPLAERAAASLQTASELMEQMATVYVYWNDLRIEALSTLAASRMLLGLPAAARAAGDDALRIARGLKHPFSLAYALINTSLACDIGLRDYARMGKQAREALQIAGEYGFRLWEAVASVLLGRAEVEAGAVGGGLDRMLKGLKSFDETQTRLSRSILLYLLAEACAIAGRLDDVEAHVLAALDHARSSGETVMEAGLLTIQADARAGFEFFDEAVELYQRAIDVSRRQQARWWAMRAATGLLQLPGSFGDRSDVAQFLSEVLIDAAQEAESTLDFQKARGALEPYAHGWQTGT